MKELVLLFLIIGLLSCDNTTIEQSGKEEFHNLEYEYNVASFETNFSNDVAKLGRVLFYDQILSENGNVSCATCHIQAKSFGDNKSLSEGFNQGLTGSNTISLVNNKFTTSFFWDGRVKDIHTAVTNPIFDRREMGMTESRLVDRVNALDYYDPLLKEAFGTNEVSQARIAEALAQFTESIISYDSKLDQYKSNEYSLTEQENQGMELFEIHCNECHKVMTDGFYSGSQDVLADIGLEDSTFGYYESRSLRIPSLRNVSLTAPYMHDGRFSTLREVITHYNEGVEDDQSRRNIHPFLLNNNGTAKKLNLEKTEFDALESFLHLLTDESIVDDKKFSDPFVR